MNPLIQLSNNFINIADKDERLIYSDTDSAYILMNLPFDKFKDIKMLVDYVQKISKLIDKTYNEALNFYMGNFAGGNEKYNTMKFKSEVVAYQGFFGGKKFYALSKAWDEGTFFEEKPKQKETGGQIRKADVTIITKEMLNKVYDILIMPSGLDETSMYKKIFKELKNEIKFKLISYINNLEYKKFGVPKKWGFKANKKITQWVAGAKLYNSLFEDIFRPGDSLIMIPIKSNQSKIINFLNSKKYNNNFQLSTEEYLDLKISTLSIPTNMIQEKNEQFIKILSEFDISADFDYIMNFNIDMKLEPFLNLFNDNIKRNIEL